MRRLRKCALQRYDSGTQIYARQLAGSTPAVLLPTTHLHNYAPAGRAQHGLEQGNNVFKCKKSQFSRTAAHIFVSPGDAPAIIMQYVAWMERQFNACQTPRSMYLSIFNSFRVIRCLSQCASPKNRYFYYIFVSPGKYPWGNHAKCCMDGKRIRCLQIVSLHVPIQL